MYWLWIAAVALLSLFFLVLCWYFFSDYACCQCRCFSKREGSTVLPTTDPDSHTYPTTAPSAPPCIPDESPVIRLTFTNKRLCSIVFEENGIPTLDLHDMTVLEARSATQGFLHRQRALGSPQMQIITGRGIHSTDGSPKIKPMVRNILLGEGVVFRETCNGGAYLVYS